MTKHLIAIRLRALFGGLMGKKKSGKPRGKGALIGLIAVYAILGIALSMFSFSIALILAPAVIELNMEWMYFTMFNILSFSIIFVLSIFETKSELFECKDNELLLSMPIKPGNIVISRIFTILILNYLEGAVFLIPAIIVFAANGGGALGTIGGLLVYLMIPLLATSLSSAFGYAVARISARLGKNSFVTTFISILFFVAYFVAYSSFMDSITMLELDPGATLKELSGSLLAFRAIGEASLLNPLPFSVMLLVCLGVSALAYFIISRSYFKIVTARHSGGKKAYRAKRLEKSSAFIALSKKELARLFSSSTYMLNSSMGVLFEIILAVVLIINRESMLAVLGELALALGGSTEILGSLCIGMTVAFAAFSSISASALSLEGKSFWIVKSAPVRAVDLLHAKLVPHLALTVPAGLIFSVSMIISMELDFISSVFVIVATVVSNLAFAITGLVLNVALPKLDYENEAQVVKQSGATTIAVLGGMIFGVLFIGISFALALFIGSFASLALLAFLLIVTVVLYFVLTGPCLRKLKRL